MIAHLLKLFWHRKASNTLLILEVFISYLVLLAIVIAVVFALGNYSRPLGFSYRDVWNVTVDMIQQSDDYWSSDQIESTRQLELTLRAIPEVEAVAGMNFVPYNLASSNTNVNDGDRTVSWYWGEVTDDIKQVLDIHVVQGRWFEQSDNAATHRPVVINRHLAEELFGDTDPIGQFLFKKNNDFYSGAGLAEGGNYRVVGLVDDFRNFGELSGPGNYAFARINLADTLNRPPRNFLMKMRPGTSPAIQQEIVKQLQNAVKGWSFEVQTLEDVRRTYFRSTIGALMAGGFIAGNLILMVTLGLIGVLWQNVTRRHAEIGLRRALGATANDVYRQVLYELIIVASAGTLLGTLVVIQFPLLGVLQSIGWPVYIEGVLISLTIMYLIMIGAAIYPSRLATRIQPIEALHAD